MRMAIDIEQHDLVPEHRVMEEDEVQDLLDQYNIGKENLPHIKQGDAVLKQVDAEVGDVIAIERDSPTAGTTTYYRRVVEE